MESNIRDVGDTFTLKLYESFLNYIDDKFKNSKERKLNYNIKETRKRIYNYSKNKESEIGCAI